jgi:hypothetical protein
MLLAEPQPDFIFLITAVNLRTLGFLWKFLDRMVNAYFVFTD